MGMGKPKLGWHGTRKRANGKYQARWCIDDSGALDSEMFLSKTQAEAYATRRANDILNVKVGLAVLRKPLTEARQEFGERRTKANTRALNLRRIDEFFAAMPDLKDTSQLTNNAINKYALILEKQGHNTGGQSHHLRIVRIFTNFCMANKWLTEDPFEEFKMPKSAFKARPVTADEYARIVGIGGARNQYQAVDLWLNWAIRFGHSTMLRSSQVWKLMAADFVEPNHLKVDPIKGQEPVWIKLHPDAVQVLKEMPIRAPGERFFSYWASVEAMRNSVEDKVRRAKIEPTIYMVNGQPRKVYPRFHDICKVTRISNLSDGGTSLGDLSELSNTSKETLVRHYIKSDRDRAFANYVARPSQDLGQHRANGGPINGGFGGSNGVQPALECTTGTIENASTSQ